MNVAELIDALADFGDHVPVALVFTKGEHEYIVKDFEVSDRGIDNELHVVIEGEVP